MTPAVYVTPTPEELLNLVALQPALAVQCPDLDKETWAILAATYPLEALRNPSLLMYGLEDPRYTWSQIEVRNVGGWLEKFASQPYAYLQLWAVECLERVLPLYRGMFPREGAIPLVIEARRSYVSGKSPEGSWLLALSMAKQVVAEVGAQVIHHLSRDSEEYRQLSAMHNFMWGCIGLIPLEVSKSCVSAQVRYHVDRKYIEKNSDPWGQERIAQWKLLLPYLREQETA